MDELLRDFLTETGESLDLVDAELVRFEQEPNNGQILGNIFRLVHTIKGTCGFLGLPRLETLTHAAENLIGKFRDGMPVTAEAVTLTLSTIDRIKTILDGLAANAQEPAGDDGDLIAQLDRLARRDDAAAQSTRPDKPATACADGRRGATAGGEAGEKPALEPSGKPAAETSETLASHSIRVSVDTLDRLMTTVSELVLTRNQLLEIVRRQRRFRLQGPVAAAVQRHRRTPGRRDEDAHAADRQCLAETAAHRARPLRRTGQGDRT